MDGTERRARVLVIDDDLDFVKIAMHFLQREGFDSLGATSGIEGLSLLAKHRIDVILLDWMMPEMDGFMVLRELKKNPATARIPVIVVTARDDFHAHSQSMRLGAADLLAKPIFRKQLGDRVRLQVQMVAGLQAIYQTG